MVEVLDATRRRIRQSAELFGSLIRNKHRHVFLLNLLEITLHNEVFDISAPNHESLPLLKIDGPKLCLYDPAIPDNVNQHMQVFGRMGNTGCDIELVGKTSTIIHHRRAVLAKEIDFMRRELAANILIAQNMR